MTYLSVHDQLRNLAQRHSTLIPILAKSLRARYEPGHGVQTGMMATLLCLLVIARLLAAESLAAVHCPFPACLPIEGRQPYGDNPSIGATPQSFDIIRPPLQAVHASLERPPIGFAVDPSLNVYLTYPRNTGVMPNNVVIPTNFTDERAWPNAEIQNCMGNQEPSTCFINVQNVVLDPKDREHVMWVVDLGIPPGSMAATANGAKIMSFNLTNNGSLIRSYPIPPALYYDGMNANDVRINNFVGTDGFAFITDESQYGSLVAVDLDSGSALRRLFNTSGAPGTGVSP